MNICQVCVSAMRGQRKAWDPLKLEVQVTVVAHKWDLQVGPLGEQDLLVITGPSHLSHHTESFCGYCFPNDIIRLQFSSLVLCIARDCLYFVWKRDKIMAPHQRRNFSPKANDTQLNMYGLYLLQFFSPGDSTTCQQKFSNSITWRRRQSKPLCGEGITEWFKLEQK